MTDDDCVLFSKDTGFKYKALIVKKRENEENFNMLFKLLLIMGYSI